MKRIIILTFCILQLSTVVKSQETNLLNNLYLELGAGYNTLGWEVKSLQENTNYYRNQFILLPSFKLKYSIPLTKLENNSVVEIAPFMGYNMFGGKSQKESNGYKDVILLQALEMGILPTWSLNSKMNFYVGFKGQYIFSAKQKSYGTVLSTIDTEREWNTNNMNELFEDISFSIGAGVQYKINRFSFGIETWFGVINLSDSEGLEIYENNYRLIVGYRIK